MARIEAGEIILEVPDCARGGDHSSLLEWVAGGVMGDGRVLSNSVVCRVCEMEVVVDRHPNTGVISASLEKLPKGGWLGM